jgi:LPP20 lipoprotein
MFAIDQERTMKPILVLFATLLLAGCATGPAVQPDWVSGDSAAYKNTQYLLGRGEAYTQEDARDRARADLAKIFQVRVNISSEDVQKFKAAGTDTGQYESQASRRITTRTEQIVRGIQIAELWQDPVTKDFHALAILPRLQTAASLREQMAKLDDATGNDIEQSRNNTDLFLKIAAANRAVEAQRERGALQKSLQIVDVTGRGVEPQWNSAKLQSDLDALLKRISIAAQVTDDSTPGLQNIVSGALAKAGFMMATGQHADFILQARMNLQDLGLQEGWYWQRGALEITLTEAANGRVRGTRRWDIKSSATDHKNLIRRALDQADAILKQELGPAIIDMASGRK